jgi:hypothetical protein
MPVLVLSHLATLAHAMHRDLQFCPNRVAITLHTAHCILFDFLQSMKPTYLQGNINLRPPGSRKKS